MFVPYRHPGESRDPGLQAAKTSGSLDPGFRRDDSEKNGMTVKNRDDEKKNGMIKIEKDYVSGEGKTYQETDERPVIRCER